MTNGRDRRQDLLKLADGGCKSCRGWAVLELEAEAEFQKREVRNALAPPGFGWLWNSHRLREDDIATGWDWCVDVPPSSKMHTVNRQSIIHPAYHAGFARGVCIREETLRSVGGAIFNAHPITDVVVFGCDPVVAEDRSGRWWLWCSADAVEGESGWPDEDESAVIPADWFDRLEPRGVLSEQWHRNDRPWMRFYRTQGDANKALSRAIVGQYRALVGLEKLQGGTP